MPKKKKAKKLKKTKISKKSKILANKSNPKQDQKTNIGSEDKPEIKKIKKQPTEKRIYNLKDYVVYAKHGVGKIMAIEKATIGQIDKEALLYLRARGISKDKAMLMLIKAFTDEVCEPIKNQTLLDAFHNIVNNWFEKSKLTN